ncbi:autophagy protein 5 [Dissophora ornata]|nr:autophagy protein 5 [Dissophora ornata]
MTPRPATTTSNAPHNPIARVIWEGSIPIQLSWDLAEVTGYSLKHIEPLLIEAPRCSYLPILTGQARNHISARHAQLTSDDSEVWYEYEGIPLKCYDLFWGMNQKLVLNDGTIARNLPIRIYLPENCPVVQEPVSPMDEQDQPRTLRQILNIALPDLFPLESSDSRQDAASVMIHGITPSLDVNALWFAQNMAYPDNFLHLVIVFSKFP